MTTAKMAALPVQNARSLYDDDFHDWARRQAELLRAGRFGELDRENLVAEIEDLGRSEAHALQSAYRLVGMHLLKLMFQPERATPSWRETIVRERANKNFIIDDFPGLKSRQQDLFDRSYPQARSLAAKETGLPIKTFPTAPPFTRQQAEDEDYWP